MKPLILSILVLILLPGRAVPANGPISESTETCLGCHALSTPGIVADWKNSRHSRVTPQEALAKPPLERRVSAEKVDEALGKNVVGCAECHTLNSGKHPDSFEHGGTNIHVVVSPQDCAVCHPVERSQYDQNLMSRAHGNLVKNPVYLNLADSVNSIQKFDKMRTTLQAPDAETNADSCLFCHGTEVKVEGFRNRETSQGEMKFPILSGWPNQGTGRINPDGTLGACTPCHTRHGFSIETARKPYTCSTCHKGPDVPAYKVYEVSKHGNLFSSHQKSWDFNKVPWTVGKDYTAPTCAACHVSLVVNEGGDVIAERSHKMSDRLPWRPMGLIYAHPYPKSPDTTIIRNKAGLPLPTELTGEPVTQYLIDSKEMEKRLKTFQNICQTCHSAEWTENHFKRLENTIRTTNEMTLTATKIVSTAWEKGVAKGLAQKDSPFNEYIEKKWVEQWLFYANSTRFASAMGGADYGVFAEGRWYLSKNIQEMLDHLQLMLKVKK
jgi:hydroxylamine dehydrogenase